MKGVTQNRYVGLKKSGLGTICAGLLTFVFTACAPTTQRLEVPVNVDATYELTKQTFGRDDAGRLVMIRGVIDEVLASGIYRARLEGSSQFIYIMDGSRPRRLFTQGVRFAARGMLDRYSGTARLSRKGQRIVVRQRNVEGEAWVVYASQLDGATEEGRVGESTQGLGCREIGRSANSVSMACLPAD